MGRSPCCAKEGLNRGAWTPLEDRMLIGYIKSHGEGKWRSLPKRAGQLYQIKCIILNNVHAIWGFVVELKFYNFVMSIINGQKPRSQKMREELQTSLVELSKTRYQERKRNS